MKTKELTQTIKRAVTHFSFFIFVFSFLFVSCNKNPNNLPQDNQTTFNIEAPSTRAAVSGLTRYIVEAYEGKDLTTTPIRVESATGSLTISLKKNTEYTFVFWADKGIAKTESIPSSGYWNTDDLQEVVVSTGKESSVGEVAYCLAKSFNSKDFETNKAVTLKNATAQLNFIEAAGLLTADNTLVVKYSNSGKLNVATGAITEVAGEVSRTHSNIAQTAKNGIVTTDYILAPLSEKRLVDLKVTLNSEPEKSITIVPFQQSYKTNVKGEFSNLYSSVFTISNQVEDYIDNEVEFPQPKVGDFYYSNNTFSSTIESGKTCIGIVFVVNADGKSGKIVSLDEPIANWNSLGNAEGKLSWGPTGASGASNLLDGAVNMGVIKLRSDWASYNSFVWADSKNTPAIAGVS